MLSKDHLVQKKRREVVDQQDLLVAEKVSG